MTTLPTILARCGLLGGWLWWLAQSAGAADSPGWFTRCWQTDEGLPNNNVTAITQTPDGFLWVGTPSGLARFDGSRFAEFTFQNPGADNDPAVHTLTAGRAGGLWIVPSRGAAVCLDGKYASVPGMTNDLPEANPLMVTEDHEGAAWIGYADGAICRVKNGRLTPFGTNEGVVSGTINSLITDNTGHVWFSKGSRVWVLNDGLFRHVASVGSGAHLAPAQTNGVWIISGRQLARCDLDGRVQNFGECLPEGVNVGLRIALEDHAGAVWIGTDGGGLFRHSESGLEKVDTTFGYITSLAEDNEGNVWVGTAGGGLDRISHASIQLEHIGGHDPGDSVQSLCEDAQGVIWGATHDGSLVIRSNGVWAPALTDWRLPKTVTCVTTDQHGGVWIGMRATRSLFCWADNKLTTFRDTNNPNPMIIVAILAASTGDVWMAVNAGHNMPPFVLRLHEGQFQTWDLPKNSARVVTLAEDAGGNIWAGTYAGGLLRAENGQFTDQTALTSVAGRTIRCLYATSDGALWIGYSGWGLGRLKDNHFTRIATEQGLLENDISQIVADDHGWFWLGGDHSIFKVRRDELEQVLSGHAEKVVPIGYGRNEGLSDLSIDFGFWPGAARTHDGRILIPARAALAVADPEIAGQPPGPPPVLFTRLTVDGNILADYGGLLATQSIASLKTLPAPLPLPPYHHNLKFEFTAFSFSAPENIHLRYRLEGLDNGWTEAAAGSAEYTRLAKGDYYLHVEAANGDGAWNEIRTPLAIRVLPFFWQTWWFRLAVVCFFTLAVIAVVRYVSFRRLRRRLELLAYQAALDKERTRIARDLHDDLGGNLTQVKQLFELALRNNASPTVMDTYLQRGLVKTQQGIRSLDETVWAVNPRNDTLPCFIDYLGQSAVEFLHAADICCRVDLPASPPDWNLSADARHHLLLAVKEALTNIVRHAQAGEVRLAAQVTPQALVLTISDDGRGFVAETSRLGADGLHNMEQRLRDIGGRFQIESRPGTGTTITFTYFWPGQKTS